MNAILASHSEIIRVGGWALRGIGYPFVVAERGVRLLAWTEAVGGRAIRSIRRSEPAIVESLAADPTQQRRKTGGGRTIHANGRHLVEIGAPVIDLATHDARRNHAGFAELRGAFGFGFLPSLARQLALRKLSAIFLYCAAKDDLLHEGFSPAGWLVVQCSGERAEFAHGCLADASGELARTAMAKAGGLIAHDMIGDPVTMLVPGIAAGDVGQFCVLVMSGAHPASKAFQESVQPLLEFGAINFPKLFADALSGGVLVQAEELDYLYGLEMRTWAPTSDRSRLQAGYGVY